MVTGIQCVKTNNCDSLFIRYLILWLQILLQQKTFILWFKVVWKRRTSSDSEADILIWYCDSKLCEDDYTNTLILWYKVLILWHLMKTGNIGTLWLFGVIGTHWCSDTTFDEKGTYWFCDTKFCENRTHWYCDSKFWYCDVWWKRETLVLWFKVECNQNIDIVHLRLIERAHIGIVIQSFDIVTFYENGNIGIVM